MFCMGHSVVYTHIGLKKTNINFKNMEILKYIYKPKREKMYILPCAHIEDSNQSVHPRSLSRAIVVRLKNPVKILIRMRGCAR